MRFLAAWIALCALLGPAVFAGESHGIDPQQDASRAKFVEPAMVLYQVCQNVPPEVLGAIVSLGGSKCETKAKYAMVPTFADAKPVVCLKYATERLAHCFYAHTTDDADKMDTILIDILLRGEST